VPARHVEIQVICDTHGNVLTLGERECSIQRRHQKLIEESPSAALTDETREAMEAAAERACRSVGYRNAGTFEFLLGPDGSFYFIELNARLQVEHPVTEMCTGIDIVREQLLVAAGEELSVAGRAPRRGHAIEIRINAENPAGGKFLPSPGTITKLVTPDGFGVRFDGGYESGDTVSQFYDNLVGKLIVWGKDRDTAIARTIRALEEMRVGGVATTIPADLAILRHPDFAGVTHSTKWVEETLDLTGVSGAPAAAPTAEPPEDGDEPEALVRRKTTVEVNGKRFDVTLWVPESAGVAVAAAGGAAKARKPRRAAAGGASGAAGSGDVTVPMQGTIVKILVEVGQEVEVGQGVVVLEAMKMENQIAAEKAGTIKEIKVQPGQTVGGGDVVAVIE